MLLVNLQQLQNLTKTTVTSSHTISGIHTIEICTVRLHLCTVTQKKPNSKLYGSYLFHLTVNHHKSLDQLLKKQKIILKITGNNMDSFVLYQKICYRIQKARFKASLESSYASHINMFSLLKLSRFRRYQYTLIFPLKVYL